jgi:beta-lactamase regulating signal transducer with metallopeptidase domain
LIFAVRAVMVSLAFFALLYTFLSLVLVLAWSQFSQKLNKRLPPDGLFMLRVAPFAISAAVSLFLILPSFIVLETHSMDEDIGTFVLGLCALLFLSVGLFRVVVAEVRTRRIVKACLEGAVEFKSGDITRAVITPKNISPLMMVGIRVSRILISQSTHHILSDAELLVAVRHEAQHLRARDNLKKAIFNCLAFPGVAGLEAAWQEAAELSADNAAVSSRSEALDLAAALIKLSRRSSHLTMPVFAIGLVNDRETTTKRVEHLLAWKEAPEVASGRWRYAILAACAASLAVAMKLGPVLILFHSITERFVP